LSPAYENYLLPRFVALDLASCFIGCAPGLSGGIGGIPLAGSTGVRTVRFGMTGENALFFLEAQAWTASRRPVCHRVMTIYQHC
jgi:hypothetical protein